jgi:hypothetical protein
MDRIRLNPTGLIAYLVRVGLVEAAAAGDLDVRVNDLSRSHMVASVHLPGGQHLIVKRARPRPGEVVGSLQRELVAYGLACEHQALSAAMPTLLWADPALQVLVMEAVEPGITLHAHAQQLGQASPVHARRLAQLIAGWHRGTRDLLAGGSGTLSEGGAPGHLGIFPTEAPWVLGILAPGRWRPPATEHLLVHGEVRRELRARFAELATVLEPSCLVHGDLKWDNCLIDGVDGVRVIDWEQTAVGDPAWDVAGILQEYVAAHRAAELPGAWEEGLEPPVGEAAATFLSAYLDAADLPARGLLADRAARLAGARLVQTALEHATVSADQRLARRLLDDARHILRDPGALLALWSAAG